MAKFVAGYTNPVAFQLSGFRAAILKITGWNASDEVQRLITTYARSDSVAGLQSSQRGIRDWTANVTANWDDDAPPHLLAAAVIPGNEGLLFFYVTSAKYYTVGCLITKVNPASAVAGLVTVNFDVAMNADMTGFVFTPPAAS